MVSFLDLGIALQRVMLVILIASLAVATIFSLIDYTKKRKSNWKPLISFIMPTYKDSESIEKTIKSIYSSYDSKSFEIFIINDNHHDSPENKETISVLNRLSKKYKFNVITNPKNLGKAASINRAFKKTHGDIISIIDSDCIISKDGVNDVIARFDENKKLGAVSLRYKVANRKGFLPLMQTIEYNMLSLMQTVYNMNSNLFLWGGFMAFRREALYDLEGFSTYCLTEDLDAALRLNKLGWEVKQSYYPNQTVVPDTWHSLYKQKLRWSGGGMQGFMKYYKIYLKEPAVIIFMVSYVFFLLNFIISLAGAVNIADLSYQIIKLPTTTLHNFWEPLMPLWLFIYAQLKNISVYFLFTIPYIIFDDKDRYNIKSYLLLVPFTLIYFPAYSVINAIGFVKAIYHRKDYFAEKRAW